MWRSISALRSSRPRVWWYRTKSDQVSASLPGKSASSMTGRAGGGAPVGGAASGVGGIGGRYPLATRANLRRIFDLPSRAIARPVAAEGGSGRVAGRDGVGDPGRQLR